MENSERVQKGSGASISPSSGHEGWDVGRGPTRGQHGDRWMWGEDEGGHGSRLGGSGARFAQREGSRAPDASHSRGAKIRDLGLGNALRRSLGARIWGWI